MSHSNSEIPEDTEPYTPAAIITSEHYWVYVMLTTSHNAIFNPISYKCLKEILSALIFFVCLGTLI